jgi:RNA polymerase-binding transcription factor DksA
VIEARRDPIHLKPLKEAGMKPTSHYKAALEARLAELDARLHRIDRDLDETPDADFEDRATERENDEVLEELGTSGMEEARQIRAALDRIEQGTYGRCANCGEPISEERLDVLPHAAVCRTCAAGG